MKINELPPRLQLWALYEQEQQGNEPNSDISLGFSDHSGNFLWDESTYGHTFWNYVDDRDFESAKRIFDWDKEYPPNYVDIDQIVENVDALLNSRS